MCITLFHFLKLATQQFHTLKKFFTQFSSENFTKISPKPFNFCVKISFDCEKTVKKLFELNCSGDLFSRTFFFFTLVFLCLHYFLEDASKARTYGISKLKLNRNVKSARIISG